MRDEVICGGGRIREFVLRGGAEATGEKEVRKETWYPNSMNKLSIPAASDNNGFDTGMMEENMVAGTTGFSLWRGVPATRRPHVADCRVLLSSPVLMGYNVIPACDRFHLPAGRSMKHHYPSKLEGCADFDRLLRIPRRNVLTAGTLSMLGGAMASTLRSNTLHGGTTTAGVTTSLGADGFGRAKRCILLFMWGGPSQLDTFDMKPDAPAEVRGEFDPIPTAVPGMQICEHFTQLAPLTDRIALVRSLSHDDAAHLSSAHTVLTGHLPPVNKSDKEPPSDRDTPHLGSLISKLRPTTGGLPPFITMPWLAYHPAAPGGKAPGQSGGFIGHEYDPLLVEGDPSQAEWQVPGLALNEGITADRLSNRQRLLSSIEEQRRCLDAAAVVANLDTQQQQAFGLLASPDVRQAFDIHQEPEEVRDEYGRNIHGQCVLLARRLVEHGVPFVSVNWHQDHSNFWDTHGDNFNKLRTSLIPPADQALAALLGDLEQRGLLDETLVVWVGEFGRRARITTNNAGREHHPWCYSGLLAGGGVRGGAVYGKSDSTASYPIENPVSPRDLTATMMHALGVPPTLHIPDHSGRPRFAYDGKPILDLFG